MALSPIGKLPTAPEAQPAASRVSTSFFQILKQTGSAWLADRCMKLAAALACYVVLALAPLVVILFKLISLILRGEKARELIRGQLQNLLGGAANGDLIDTILNSSRQGAGTLATVVSVVILLFGASGIFGELQDSMNRIWAVEAKAGMSATDWLRSRFVSMAMVLGLGFLLLVSFFASTVITSVSQDVLGNGKIVAIGIDLVVSLGVITAMLAMIYKWLPDVKIAWKDVWLGAFATAVLFIAGKWGLTLYFRFGAPASAYGAFGALAAVVIWVYYAAQILFFGAELTKVHARAHGPRLLPAAYAQSANGDALAGNGNQTVKHQA